jgi:hypothetical protein
MPFFAGRLLSFLAATMLGMWQGRLGMISSQSNRHVWWNPAIVWLSWPFDDSQDSGYLHLVLPRTSAKKSATPPSLLLRGERARERERESPHIFPEAMLRSIFVRHCLGSAMFVAGEHHSFFAFQPRVVSRSIASESIVHFDILQMRKPKACERSGPKLPAEQVEPFGLWVSSALCHSYPVPRFTLCKSDLAMKHPPLGSWVC